MWDSPKFEHGMRKVLPVSAVSLSVANCYNLMINIENKLPTAKTEIAAKEIRNKSLLWKE